MTPLPGSFVYKRETKMNRMITVKKSKLISLSAAAMLFAVPYQDVYHPLQTVHRRSQKTNPFKNTISYGLIT